MKQPKIIDTQTVQWCQLHLGVSDTTNYWKAYKICQIMLFHLQLIGWSSCKHALLSVPCTPKNVRLVKAEMHALTLTFDKNVSRECGPPQRVLSFYWPVNDKSQKKTKSFNLRIVSHKSLRYTNLSFCQTYCFQFALENKANRSEYTWTSCTSTRAPGKLFVLILWWNMIH